MSNLGTYQVMTSLAKKVGGPVPLGLIIFGSGSILTGIIMGTANKIKQLKRNSDTEE